MSLTPVKQAKFTVTIECSSYDNTPSEDDIVEAITEGLEDSYPNMTTKISVNLNHYENKK